MFNVRHLVDPKPVCSEIIRGLISNITQRQALSVPFYLKPISFPQIQNHSTASYHSMSDSDRSGDDLFQAGLKVRREVLGDDYVNKALQKQPNSFTQPLQDLVTKSAWGMVWTRPGLSRAQRSMINIALLATLNRPEEFKLHLRGAIRNGVSKAEIQEILLHMSMYAGLPAAVSAFKIADEVLKDIEDVPNRKSKL